MFYLYFIDNFGRATLTHKSNSKEKLQKCVIDDMQALDPDTNRYLIISTKKIPTYEVKGINE